MDFDWSPEDAAFREEVRDWLHRALEQVDDLEGVEVDGVAGIPRLLEWERLLSDASYNAVDWPLEFGGQGMNVLRSMIFTEEYYRAGAPRRLNYPGLGLLGPTLMAAGTPEQQTYYLPRILSCEHIWCQGFSEPNAGSDLASLTTRAERDGDHYVVNGQKVWTSNALRANHIFALVRTNPSVPKHKGISYLLIDLSSPGVEVRPLKQISGATLFAEVFFDEVVVPVADRVGDEGEGWRVAYTTLGIERNAARAPALLLRWNLGEVRFMAKAAGMDDDPSFQLEAARIEAAIHRYEINHYASMTSPRPEATGDLSSMSKYARSLILTDTFNLGLRLLGGDAELGATGLPAGVQRDWHERYWHARASTIYGGTSEIQLNIFAERILGLPKDR